MGIEIWQFQIRLAIVDSFHENGWLNWYFTDEIRKCFQSKYNFVGQTNKNDPPEDRAIYLHSDVTT